MNDTIDERVLSMRFDNREFEKNIQQTTESLKEFDESLEFKGKSAGLEKLQNGIAEFAQQTAYTFDGMVNGIEYGFLSVADRIRNVFINKLGGELYDFAKKYVKMFSVDQVSAGLSKYEEQTRSSFTIMSATGKSVEEVDTALDRLMWFADETSYSFTDMVNNVGKFTSQNIDLDVAVKAMMGISTAASLAGQGTAEASRAMYNFSQSLAAGSVKLQDWKSIENANMATAEFKQTIIDTAKELGVLNDSSKTKRGTLVTLENFSSTLSEGWFTSDVLLKALEKYGGYADVLYEYINTHDVDTAAQAMQELGDAGDALGSKAFKAAQEARTFTDAVNATTDAVSSGWMQSFKYVLGDTDQATVLFTDMANALWEVFASGSEVRNEALKAWNEAGGREQLLRGIYDALDGLWGIIQTMKDALSVVFPQLTADRLLAISEAVENVGKKLKETFGIIETTKKHKELVVDVRVNAETNYEEALEKGMKGDQVREMQEWLSQAGYYIGAAGVDGIFGPQTEAALKQFQEDMGHTADGIYDDWSHMRLGSLLFGEVTDEHWEVVEETTTELPPALEKLSSAFENLGKVVNVVVGFFKFLWNILKRVWDITKPIRTVISDLFQKLLGFAGQWADGVLGNGVFEGWFEWVDGKLTPVSEKIEAFSEKLREFFGLDLDFESFGDWIEYVKGQFKALFSQGDETDDGSSSFIDRIKSVIDSIKAFLGIGQEVNSDEESTSFLDKIKNIITSIKEFFGIGKEADASEAESTEQAVDTAGGLVEKVSSVFSGLDGNNIADTITQVATSVGSAFLAFKAFKGVSDAISGITDFLSIGSVLKKTVGTFPDIMKQLKEGIENFGGIGEAIQERIKGGKAESFAQKVLKIAFALVLIAGAIFIVAQLSIADLAKGVVTLGLMLGLILLLQYISTKMPQGKARDTSNMVALAAGLFLIAISIKMLGEMKLEQLAAGLMALIVVMGLVTAFIVITNKMQAGTKGLIALSVALLLIALVIKILGKMDPAQAFQGIVALGLVFAELAIFIAMTNKMKAGTTLVRMLALSLILLVASIVVKKLGEMDVQDAFQGVVMLGIIFAELALFMRLTSKTKAGTTLASMIALSIFLNVASSVVQQLGEMDPLKALQGVVALGLIMAELYAFMMLTNKTKAGTSLLTMLSLVLFLEVAAHVVGILGEMDPLKALQGIAALGVIMLELAAFMKLTTGAKSGASLITMISLSIFMGVATAVVKQLGEMDTRKAIQGVAALGVILLELGIFMKVAGKMTGFAFAGAIVTIADSVKRVADVLVLLSALSLEQIRNGGIALTLIITELTVMILAMSKMPPPKITSMLSLLAITAAMKLLAGSFIALGKLSLKQCLAAAIGMGAIMVALLGSVKLMSLMGSSGIKIKTMLSLVAIAVVLTYIIMQVAAAIILVKDVKPEVITGFAEAMAVMFSSLIAVLAVSVVAEKFGGARTMAKGALGVMAVFAIVVGIVGAVLTGLGALNDLGGGDYLVSKIESGGAVLKALAKALDVLGDPIATAEAAGVALAVFEAVGLTGPTTVIKGAAAVTGAFAIAGGIALAVVAGIGYINESGGETTLLDAVKSGGEVLKELANAINVFDFETPAEMLTNAATLLIGFTIAGLVGPVMDVGAAVIGAAFAIAVGIALAVVGGIGYLNENTGETTLLEAVQNGGKILHELANAINVFDFETPEQMLTLAAEALIAMTLAGLVGPVMDVGAAAIGAAFGIATLIGVAIVGGLGYMNENSEGETSLVDAINSGGEVLSALVNAIDVFDLKTPEAVLGSIAGIAIGMTLGGLVAPFMEIGAAAIGAAFSIAVGMGIILFEALDYVNSQGGDKTLIEKINGGGEVLKALADAINVFDLKSPDEMLKVAAEAAIGMTIGGLVAPFLEVGAVAITSAFTIAVGIAAAALSGLDAINDAGGENTLVDAITGGGEVLTAIGGALGGFVHGFKTMMAGGEEATSEGKMNAATLQELADSGITEESLQPALDTMGSVATFMDTIGGYEHLDKAPSWTATLFGGEKTAFQTVLEGIKALVDTFTDGTIEEMPYISAWSKTKLSTVLDFMDVVATFMDKIGAYENLDREQGAIGKMFGGEETAFQTVLNGIKSSVDLFTDSSFKIGDLPTITDETKEKLDSVLGFMDTVAIFMNNLGGDKYSNLEHEAGAVAAIFKDKTSYQTVLTGVQDTIDMFTKGTENGGIDITNLPNISTTAQSNFARIISMMTQIAVFMNALGSDELQIEAEPSAIAKWFGADSTFNQVLSGTKDAVGTFGEIRDALTEANITEDDLTSFTDFVDILGSIAGVMSDVSTITGGSYDYMDLWQFMNSMTGQVTEFSSIVNDENYDGYVATVEAVAGAYADIAAALAEIVKYVDNKGTLDTVNEYGKEIMDALGTTDDGVVDVSSSLASSLTTATADGIVSSENVSEAVRSLIESSVSVAQGFYIKFKTVGLHLDSGLATGIRSNTFLATGAMRYLIEQTIKAGEEAAGINSPSKVTKQMGIYLDQGLAQGVTEESDATRKTVISTVGGMLATLSTLLADGVDTTPTITPVLDLSNVTKNVGLLDQYLSGKTLNVSTSGEIASYIHKGGTSSKAVQGESSSIVTAINDLRKDVNELKTALGTMNVVMDSGALVGQIGPRMDGYLGHRAALERRRG